MVEIVDQIDPKNNKRNKRAIRTLLEPSESELRRKESLKMKSLRTASIESDPSIVLLPDRCLAVSYNGFSVGSVVAREQQGNKKRQNDLSITESSLDGASNHSNTGKSEL